MRSAYTMMVPEHLSKQHPELKSNYGLPNRCEVKEAKLIKVDHFYSVAYNFHLLPVHLL